MSDYNYSRTSEPLTADWLNEPNTNVNFGVGIVQM